MENWIEILLRSIGLFFITFLMIRIIGQRQISRVTPFQFVYYTAIAVLAALISVNMIPNLAFGFIALGVWTILPIIFEYISLKSKALHDVIYGKENILIRNGKIMEENMSQLKITGEELLRELRYKNIFNLADVEFAIMESTGELNVLLKSDKQPITPCDMGKEVPNQKVPQTIILDGNILDEPLSTIGLDRNWVKLQLDGQGISLDNVFLGQVDGDSELYLDLFDDAIQVAQPKVKELLYANLQKCEADFFSFFMETKDENVKKMYLYHANQIKEILNQLKPYLLH
ncbi:DUF421 domain-containing protein [Inediibacterium massiliense]|uniref:DUF421 domain-containing protein n=1 Tax=Inediibacterium massiliense TaxID=1658111 RepID=UPI0006B6506B|nr:DUF421 domain-containing protein [Inediibacterium massiliense]